MLTLEEKKLLDKAIAINLSNIANGMTKSSGVFRLSDKNPGRRKRIPDRSRKTCHCQCADSFNRLRSTEKGLYNLRQKYGCS